jgi:DNA polymerase-1
MSEKVYLVDGSGYIFRAFYAVAPLTTKSGFPTNALFGFTKMLKKLIEQAQSEYVVVVFDSGRETFRKELYADYKANRTEPPEELKQQFPFFPKIAEALGLPIFTLPGYEADDIIGTLSHKIREAGDESVIVSADKDFMQLIGAGVSIWDTMNDRQIAEPEVKLKFGVAPDQVADILALIGDSSDNIPGLSGVGPKTAAQLIEKFGNIEAVLAGSAAIKEDKSIRNRLKIAEAIESDADTIRLSKRLATIVIDAPIEFSHSGQTFSVTELKEQDLLKFLRRRAVNQIEVKKLIKDFQFESLLSPLLKATSEEAQEDVKTNYQIVSPDNFDSFLQSLAGQPAFAFDLETTSLDPLEAKIVGFSFSWKTGEGYYLPLEHVSGEAGSLGLQSKLAGQVATQKAFEKLKPILENPQIKKCGQNLKFDIKVLLGQGIETQGVEFDSMVAAYLLNPDRGSYNLTTLAEEYLGKAVIEYSEVTEAKSSFAEVDLESAKNYACQDADYAWSLKQKLSPLIAEQALTEVLQTIDLPLVPVLSKMELAGVEIDTALLSEMSHEFAQRLGQLELQIYELAGSEFNINSPKQVSDILFNKLQLPTKGLKKTKTGVSSDASVLEKLAEDHDLPRVMLEYRGLHKLKSTYVDALPESVSNISGRLHTSFNQTVTATGRLSSSSPNLQNIPIASPDGARIRAAFVAPEGKLLISADYSQIELRLLAHIAEDVNMRAAFEADADIHTQTARELLGIAAGQEIKSEQRRIGKTMNFAIIYGMGAFRLSKELGVSFSEAENYIKRYFDLYSGVRDYFKLTEEKAIEQGYVTTIFGRKRFINSIDASGRDKGFIVRAALNAPIQGSAADIIKLAMISLDREISTKKYPLKLIMQIHDELVFEVDHAFAEEGKAAVVSQMENVVQLSVPMKVDAGLGSSWQVAHA